MGLTQANSVGAPGIDEPGLVVEEPDTPLSPQESREYRALAARTNYLAMDRSDIQYAVKEACRGMAALHDDTCRTS